MGIFNRDDDRGRGFRGHYDRDLGHAQGGGGWERVERGFRGRDPNDVGMRGDYENRPARDYGAGQGMWGRSGGYDRDMSPTEAGWRAGGMSRGGRGDFGYQGGYDRGMRGDDRNFLERAGGSIRRGWNEMTGDDYDRGYRGGGWGRGDMDRNDLGRNDLGRNDYGSEYGRGMRGSAWEREGRYGQGVGYEPGFPRDRYGYDRHEYKSRYQTDAGDPFGDRQSHTPVRMVNEDYTDRLARRNAYDADVRRDRDWF